MLITHFLSAQSEEFVYFKERLKTRNNLFFQDKQIEDKLEEIKDTEILNIFIYNKVNKKILDGLPKLKLIVTRSTGFDHIDLSYAKEKGVTVCNVPTYGENTVAEHAFALLLSIVRKIPEQINRTNTGNFEYEDLRGLDIRGKTLGVIGAGHIGLHSIKIGGGLGMKVIAFDLFQKSFLSEVLDFDYVSMDELLRESDVITLHAPYNKHTHHLINKESFQKMKKGMVLINTSRGALVDNEALVEALDQEIVAAAGLDVLENEESLLGCKENETLQKLISRKNVYFTAHTAYYTKEAQERIWETTLNNIKQYLKEEPINAIN